MFNYYFFDCVSKFVITIEMEFVSSNNLRIRGDTIPNLDAEKFIKAIEIQCDIDIATSPRWRDVITRIEAVVIECKRRVKDHKLRNSLILQQLQKEFTYVSPFNLTDILARTARKWERLKTQRVIKLDPIMSESIQSISSKITNPKMEEEEIPEITLLFDEADVKEKEDTFMPPLNIYTISSDSTNYDISPVRSKVYKEIIKRNVTMRRVSDNSKSAPNRRLLNTNIIKSSPKNIIISSTTDQILEFKLKNCALQMLMIQYHSLTEKSQFQRVAVLPAIPVKLVPGITYTFKLIFKLWSEQDFTTKIKFLVKYSASTQYFEYFVPIISLQEKKLKYRSVKVSEIIVIPKIYSWQLKNKSTIYEYPFGISELSINTKDTHFYYVRIVKREMDIASYDDNDTMISNEVNTPTTVLQNVEDEIRASTPSEVLSPKLTSDPHKGLKSFIDTTMSYLDVSNEMSQLVNEAVECAMDVFVFEKTNLFLKSGETKSVRVYFTQIDNIGCHNCFYDFKFYDYESNELIFTKTTRVFADIMPHPIQVMPDELDMTDTPIIFGHCINSFVLTNNHYVYPVNIRIETSAKMQKLLKIEPIQTVILPKKSAKFVVNFCISDWEPVIEELGDDDLTNQDQYFVQFTIKILISGYAAVYKNISPIYYNITAPCIHEYEYVYRKKNNEVMPN